MNNLICNKNNKYWITYFKQNKSQKNFRKNLKKSERNLKKKSYHLESKVQKKQEKDSYQLQQELDFLKKPKNFQQFIYYKSLFWRLYNYLHARQLMSTNLFAINRKTMIESNSEKVAEFFKTMSNTVSFLMGSELIVGTTFNAINLALDHMVEKQKKFPLQVLYVIN